MVSTRKMATPAPNPTPTPGASPSASAAAPAPGSAAAQFQDAINQQIQKYEASQTGTKNVPPQYIFSDGTLDLYSLGAAGDQLVYTGPAGDTGQRGPSGIDSSTGQTSAGPNVAINGLTHASAILDQIAQMSVQDPTQFAAVQSQLKASGAYGDSTPTWGVWTAKDGDAMSHVLRGYLQVVGSIDPNNPPANIPSFNDWLANTAAQGQADANAAAKQKLDAQQAPTAPQYDTTTVQKLGQDASQAEFGSSNFGGNVGALQSALNANSQADAAAGTNGTITQGQGGVNTAVGDDPQAFAQNWVVQNNLPQYAAHQVESYANVFANMFLDGSSARAKTTTGDVALPGAVVQ